MLSDETSNFQVKEKQKKRIIDLMEAVTKLKETLQSLSDVTTTPSNDKLENEFFFYDILDGNWKHHREIGWGRTWVEVMITEDIDLGSTPHTMKYDVRTMSDNTSRRRPKGKQSFCKKCNI